MNASIPRTCLGLLLALLTSSAWCDPVNVANGVRQRGCGGRSGGRISLQRDSALDAVARRLATGGRLRDALAANGYRAEASFSMHISNSPSDAALERSLSQGFCAKIMDAHFQRIGVYRKRADTWLVFAEPFAVPKPGDASSIARRALERVNEARSHSRRCGAENFSAVGRLQLNPLLEQAAAAHAKDMAERDELSHQGRDGSSPAQRVAHAGYRWHIVGENVASGPTTIDEAVTGWLESPGHCANIMNARFTAMGVSYAVNPRSHALIYWAQDFAAP